MTTELFKVAHISPDKEKNVAYLAIENNKVVASSNVKGLDIAAQELADGIDLKIIVKENIQIEKPVHLCFGMMHEKGFQRILIDFRMEKNSKVDVFAHCVFPNAKKIKHLMDAKIHIGEGARYSYIERHIHGKGGGVLVVPKARVTLEKNSRFRTDFELLQGRAGTIEIDYDTYCKEGSVMEMTARISGSGDDVIRINESGHLAGENSKGALTSRIAVRGNAKAEVHNKLTASAAGARGHVDCKEIVQDNAVAQAIPIVEVSHPKAHVTHEAAIGSVDSKQLDTLMSRGLSEDEAVEVIIQGLLS